ncbi:MAG: efflux RND transporter permease subunit, partial [bacterium]|nr:efflux RND transporter permease subunit [bacterium]
LFLNFRSSFWIAMSIPTSIAVALIVIPWFGVDLNAITLAAMVLVLGMLVDDSVVVAENIFSHRHTKPPFEAARDGTLEVYKPVLATVLTTFGAFAPMLAMSGIMGRFIYVIPVTIIAALAGSLIDCYFILPNHLQHSTAKFQATDEGWRSRMFSAISRPYQRSLRWVLKFRYPVILFALILLAFTLYWGKSRVGFNLFPTDGSQIFYIYMELDEEVTFDATEEVVNKVEQAIQQIPEGELEYYYGRIGTQDSDPLLEPVGGEENLAYVQVTLVPWSKRRGRTIEAIQEEVRQRIVDIPEIKELRFEIEKGGPPAGVPITFHVHSDNDEQRKYFVDRMVEDLKKMKGVSDVHTSSKVGREEYKLNLDYKKLAAAGLTVNDVASTLRVAFDGVDATSVVKDNEEIKIRVRFPPEHRKNVKNVLNLQIRNKEGKLVPVWAFAELGTIRADTAIHHTDGDVTTTLFGQTDGVSILPKTAIDALMKKYSPELVDYPDVSFSYGGEAEKTEESMRSLFFAFAGGVIGIYLILVILFNSLSQPFLILLAVPFGMIGVTWAFFVHGIPFSFLGLIGIVGLSGVVVNDSLVMVDFINKLVREKLKEGVRRSKELKDQVIQGAARRLRPVIITTVTTVMGLLPTAYGIGGSDPFIAPMVLAVAYGLLFATFLTLFLLPCFYLVNQDLYFLMKFCSRKFKGSNDSKDL